MKNWQHLQRHPLSCEYRDIQGLAWGEFLDGFRRRGFLPGHPIMLHEGKILDGWQRQRASLETGIEPEYKEWKPTKGCDTPEDYVVAVNDARRHDTPEEIEERVSKRRQRVTEAREAGKSIRTIAEEEGVSPKTVQNDLATSSGVDGYTPEPEEGKVAGRDGKTYPSTPKRPEPAILCNRCQRLGTAVRDCQTCKAMREEAKQQTAKPASSEPVDDFKNVLPTRCRDAFCDPWIQKTYDFLCLMSEKIRAERIGDGIRKRARRYPFFKEKDIIDGAAFIIQYLDDLISHFKNNRPAAVCPGCDGKGCADCLLSGLLPRQLYLDARKGAAK